MTSHVWNSCHLSNVVDSTLRFFKRHCREHKEGCHHVYGLLWYMLGHVVLAEVADKCMAVLFGVLFMTLEVQVRGRLCIREMRDLNKVNRTLGEVACMCEEGRVLASDREDGVSDAASNLKQVRAAAFLLMASARRLCIGMRGLQDDAKRV